jgi:hypothetical protein
MRWITLLLQLVSFRSSLLESKAMIENAKAAAEKGKRAAMFSGVFLLAVVYFLVGSILTVVELGLQADRGEFIRLSGLLGASLFLILVSALIVGAAVFFFGGVKSAPPPPPRAEPDLKAALEGVLVTFLSQMAGKLREGRAPRGHDEA